MARRWLGATLACAALTGPLGAASLHAQDVGRRAVERLRYPELRFDPPKPEVHELPGGVPVYLLEDHSLPLVNVLARFEGGYANFGREYYAAGTALPSLLRGGGTRDLTPDSVDVLLEYYAAQTTFGGAGESTFSALNTLSEHLGPALAVWGEILEHPRFDSTRLEVWRGQEQESVTRRKDNPGQLAFSEFNRLMYGDHPIGWELAADDLTPERLSRERVRWLQRRILCPGNLVLGVTGDVSWEEIRPRLEALLADWPACPEPLPEAPLPTIRTEPGVFLIPRPIDQSTVVLAHTTALRQSDTRDYFASRIGNAILGASGLSSRLLTRVRTEAGYAYSASSLWTAPVRYDGLIGATTRTRGETTVAAIRLVEQVMEDMVDEAPDSDEVATTVEEATNGFVFNFQAPSQVISRQMFYEASGLPADWLERYLRGLQQVHPRDVRDVFRRYLDLDRMVILVVGNPDTFDQPLESLGPVTILDLAEPEATSGPSGSPRSRR